MLSTILLLCTTLLLVAGTDSIADGESKEGKIRKLFGGHKDYVFHLGEVLIEDADLKISVTPYSDWNDPDLYVREGHEASKSHHDWGSSSWGSDHVIIAAAELKAGADYFIDVKCATYCRFYVTVAYKEEIMLTKGVSLAGHVKAGYEEVFKYVPGEGESCVYVTLLSGRVDMYAGLNQIANKTTSQPVSDTWDSGKSYCYEGSEHIEALYVTVYGNETSKFGIVAVTGNDTVIELRASYPTGGLVSTGEMNYYRFEVESEVDSDIVIQVTPFSGNPDIYVKATGNPTLEQFDFKSDFFGNDTLVITNAQRKALGMTEVYIGIYGDSQSSYILTASVNSESFTFVTPGVPSIGQVDSGATKYYNLHISEHKNLNISIFLTTEIGDVDLFVKLCHNQNETNCTITPSERKNPANSSLHYSVGNESPESILFIHNATACPINDPCNYVLAVYGSSAQTSKFTLTVTETNTTSHILRDGQPVSQSSPPLNYMYFKYTVHNITTTNLTFTLSSITGHLDLYVSRTGRPSMSSNEKSAASSVSGIETVTYEKGLDGEDLLGDYYVAAYSIDSSVFSLVVKEERPEKKTTVHLYPGHPERDMIYNITNGDYRIYYFTVHFTEQTKQNIRISLTPLAGTFKLYAANNPGNLVWSRNTFYYNWKSLPSSQDPENVINIHTNDSAYRINSTYLVLVMGKTYTPQNTATYSIVYQIGNGTVTLTEDVPYNGQVALHEYKYYRFPIHYTHEDLKISLTALSGDADLYVSFNPNNHRPSQSAHDVSSNNFGSDVITIVWDDHIKQNCPNLPTTYHHGDPTHCMAYISVYGYSPSHYTIKIHPSQNYPQALILGQPQTGFLKKSDYEYYYVIVGTNLIASVSVQPVSGDADLFMDVLDSTTAGDDSTKWSRPSRTNHNEFSQSSMLTDTVSLSTAQLNSYCPSGTCVLVSGVYCFSGSDCMFTITASQNSTIPMLMENEARFGDVLAGEYVYFKYFCNVPNNNIVISLTVMRGDPDMYVTRGRETLPTFGNSTWKSQRWGNDTIVITPTDEYFVRNTNITIQGTYIIGVSSFMNTSFMITVNNHPIQLTRLSRGIPSSNTLAPYSSAYYYFYNMAFEDIVLTLTPRTGSAVMTVKATTDWGDDIGYVYENLPTREEYSWSSYDSNDMNRLEIYHSDTNFCIFCDYAMGVFTGDTGCSYSITMSNHVTSTILQNGVIVKGELVAGESQFFAFNVHEKQTLDIVLSSYSGDADLTVGTTAKPSNWHSEEVGSVDHIRIDKDDPDLEEAEYRITLDSLLSSSYSIVAHMKDTYIQLIDGWFISYSLAGVKYDRVLFQYKTIEQVEIVQCTLTSSSYDKRPLVYINFAELETPDIPPDSTNSQTQYFQSDYDDIYETLHIRLETNNRVGHYNIGIYSNTTSTDEEFPVTFDFSCSGNVQTTILALNASKYEILESKTTKKMYELTLDTPGHLEVYVTPCAGRLMLQISRNWNTEEEDPSVNIDIPQEGGVLIGTLSKAKIGTYYLIITVIHESTVLIDGAAFEISTKFVGEEGVVPHLLVAGNYGRIEFKYDKKSIILNWDAIEYENGTPYPNNQTVTYMIFVTHNLEVSFVSACGMHLAASHNEGDAKEIVIGKTSAEFGFDTDKSTMINILAVVRDASEESPLKRIPYDPVVVNISESRMHPPVLGFILFWVIISLLVVFFIAAIVFYKKFKKAKVQLNYEMEDVRNVAGRIEGKDPLEYKSKPYEPLQEESKI